MIPYAKYNNCNSTDNAAYANLMNSVKEYARQWENRERQDIDTLSEWGYEVVDTNRIKILIVGQ